MGDLCGGDSWVVGRGRESWDESAWELARGEGARGFRERWGWLLFYEGPSGTARKLVSVTS